MRARLLIAFATSAVLLSIGLVYLFPAPPSRVVLAAAFKGTGFYYFGERYREALAPYLDVELRETGSVENLRLLQDKKSNVQLGFVLGGISNADNAPGLLSLGTIYRTGLWLIYKSANPISDLSELKHKKIALGPVGGSIRATGEKVLAAAGITSENSAWLSLGGDAAIGALREGEVDAVWTTGPADGPILREILRSPQVRLFHFINAEAYARRYPEFVRLDLPRGVLDLANNIPSQDMTVLAAPVRVLVRDDLNPQIVALFLHVMQRIHGRAGPLQKSGEFPTISDPEYVMAPAAIDYYKNGPSFVQAHVPLWLTPHVHRAIIFLATMLPLIWLIISGEPTLYRWIIRERARPLYRQLRVIERNLGILSSDAEAIALLVEIEKIDNEARLLKIPNRYADSLFSLKVHINLLRTRLNSRIAELRAQT